MKKFKVMISVDLVKLGEVRKDFSEESLEESVIAEFGWLSESGIRLEKIERIYKKKELWKKKK